MDRDNYFESMTENNGRSRRDLAEDQGPLNRIVRFARFELFALFAVRDVRSMVVKLHFRLEIKVNVRTTNKSCEHRLGSLFAHS